MLLFLSFIALALPSMIAHNTASEACTQLRGTLSESSGIFEPGSLEYDAGVKHWAASSSQAAACVVEPGSAEDVAEIVSSIFLH